MRAIRERNDDSNFFDLARQSMADRLSLSGYAAMAGMAPAPAAILTPGPHALIDTVPGDTSTTAVLTVGAASIISAIDTIADEDFYQITLVAGHVYEIGMFGYTPPGPGDPIGPNGAPLLDSFLELYDSTGHLITSADGGSDTTINAANSGFDALLTFTATTTGTYYVNARAFDNVPADGDNGDMVGDYGLYAKDVTDAPGYVPYYDANSPLNAIDWGTQVNKIHQSYRNPDGNEGIRTTGNPQAPVDPGAAFGHPGKNVISVYFAVAGDVFVSNDPTNPGLPPATITATGVKQFEHDAVMTALAQFSLVADVVYIEVSDRNQADFIYTSYQGTPGPGISLLGSMSPPDESDEGLAQFNSGDQRWNAVDLQQGGFSFVTLIHELGHGHGLAHPHDNGGHSGIMHGVEPEGAGVADYTTGDFALNQGVFTMMSYEDGWQSSPYGNAPTSGGYGYLSGLMAFDIAAIQDKYGVNEDTALGDNLYVMKDVNAPGTYFTCIWDMGGMDTIQYSGARDATIDLRAATLQYEEGGGGRVSYAYGIYGGYTIANSVVIENATTGSGNDRLIGNDVSNGLDGGAGADELRGGLGNDYYVVDNAGDAVFESAAAGYDIVFAKASFTLASGQEVESLGAYNQAGTEALILTGNEFANRIVGNAGVNSLDGGAGADQLYGAGGGDYYVVDTALDQVFESSGQGYDIVFATASYRLGAGQEIESLGALNEAGTGALDLTGNEFANRIVGNAGSNTLDGGAGADQLYGGGGNDFYIVDNALDQVLEGGGQGYDIVFATGSYQLAAGQEIESLGTLSEAGTAAINLTGNELANRIVGNAGSNTINGGAGGDLLYGGGGADTFAFSTVLGGGNVDHLGDFLSGTDHIALDHGVFSALGLGALSASAFVAGTGPQDADDRIIYNAAIGSLFYDPDGTGAAAAIQFATVQPGMVINAADFVVI